MNNNIISFPGASAPLVQEPAPIPESAIKRQFWGGTLRQYEDPAEMARAAREAFSLGFMSYELMQWFCLKANERKNRN